MKFIFEEIDRYYIFGYTREKFEIVILEEALGLSMRKIEREYCRKSEMIWMYFSGYVIRILI
ncbi:MAG: hypothetical protein HUJ74_03100 [Lachnospiraceae bacterium]|nr:hypothetical protein [Lachnospiraceae bacterium]